MKDIDYEILDNATPDDHIWKEWQTLVNDERWTSDDLSVLTLTPILSSTRIVLARKRDDGSFIGAVIWNEYDDIAFIGFYLLIPEYRGKGIGSVLWERAMSKIPKHYTIGLRAVPNMVERYKSKDTPIEGPAHHAYEMDLNTLSCIAEAHASKKYVAKMVNELSKIEYRQLEQFCLSVVKRDRSEFLRLFHNLSFTFAAVLFDDEHNVIAYAAICPTTHLSNHLYKLAPLYASSISEGFAVIQPLIEKIRNLDGNAQVILHILDGSIGLKLLHPLFNALNLQPKTCGVTLFSREFHNPIDTQRLFIAHNNSGHFDA